VWTDNNPETWKNFGLLWEEHFIGYYLQDNSVDWMCGENYGQFWAAGSLSQCLEIDICNVREIREDPDKLSVPPKRE
jgi:hypothetical protein